MSIARLMQMGAAGASKSNRTYYFTSGGDAPIKSWLSKDATSSNTFTSIDTETGSGLLQNSRAPFWIKGLNQLVHPRLINSDWYFYVVPVNENGTFGTAYQYNYEAAGFGSQDIFSLSSTADGAYFYAYCGGGINSFANSGTSITHNLSVNLGFNNSVERLDTSINDDLLCWIGGTRVNLATLASPGGDTVSRSSDITNNTAAAVAFNPVDNDVFAVAEGNGGSQPRVRVYRRSSGASFSQISSATIVGGSTSPNVTHLAWSPDGTALSASGTGVRYFDVQYRFWVFTWDGTSITRTDWLGFDGTDSRSSVWLDDNTILVSVSRSNDSLNIVDATNKSNISVSASLSNNYQYYGLNASLTL